MATSYTPNYNLDLYTDTDKPNLRDQYNGAMNKIDSQFTTVSNNIVVAIEAANQAKDKADSASDSAATNAQSIATLNNTVSGIDTAYKAADSSIIEAYEGGRCKAV
jgi:methylaspartate ammonia-lyase